MMPCPSDEKLAQLLSDALDPTEQDAVAQHIESCAPCQRKLAELSDDYDSEVWPLAGSHSSSNSAEEELVRRLKAVRPSSAQSLTDASDATIEYPANRKGSAASQMDAEPSAVPGYKLIGVLGRGGVGVVFKARQISLQREVAIKMLQNWSRAGERELARFRAEADVIAHLQHPNIVQIYDVGQVDGRPFFVLEYVTGG